MISERLKKVEPAPTLAIDAKTKQMIKEGVDIVGFGVGEPDFNTPENIKEAGIQAIRANRTRYTAAAGIPELKTAVADKLKRENGLNYKPSEIVVSCGAKHTLFNIFMALLNPGDEVIIFSPYWVSYPDMTLACTGEPVIVQCPEADDFKLTPAALARLESLSAVQAAYEYLPTDKLQPQCSTVRCDGRIFRPTGHIPDWFFPFRQNWLWLSMAFRYDYKSIFSLRGFREGEALPQLQH